MNFTRHFLRRSVMTHCHHPCHQYSWKSTLASWPKRRHVGRTMSLWASPAETSALREELRAYGSEDDGVTLTMASDECHSDSPLHSLGDSTAVVTLRNPTARNALTGKMMAELADVVTTLETDAKLQESLTAVVVRGDGDFFCAGADIRVAADKLSTKEGGRAMSTLMIDTLTRLRHLPYLTVACIAGGAVGGGAELTTALDYRIVHAAAVLRFVHAHMGVSPGWGGATRLVRLVGRNRALELLGTAAPCDAATCLAMGLIDQVVDKRGDMDTRVVQFLDPFVHAHPAVLHAAKRVVAGAQDAASFEDAVAVEHAVFMEMWGGPANRAALEKAQKKRSK